MTLADFETGKRSPYDRTLSDIEAAFRGAGLMLIEADDAAGSGVRFMHPNDSALDLDKVPEAMSALRRQHG